MVAADAVMTLPTEDAPAAPQCRRVLAAAHIVVVAADQNTA